MNRRLVAHSALGSALFAGLVLSEIAAPTARADAPPLQPSPEKGSTVSKSTTPSHPYVGMWVTRDGVIRHELLPDDRYDEARGQRRSAYQGRYRVTGNHIDYWDDTGFTADGEFRDGILYHAGMVLYRER